jgi:tetratricopeptide (TPR) repeat protein
LTQSQALFNPFPGLRPFEAEEDHLFFGREKEIDELLRRLRSCHFLSVIGSSGSGKSSLVRSGLIPALYSGYMVKAGSSWRVTKFRPGEDPVGHLAESLSAPDVLGTNEELGSTNRVLLEATLRRSSRGLVDALHQARIPPHDNLLIVVDQFEELFRFRRSRQIANSRDEAVAFVKLLLEAANETTLPIYVVLTMRSDFIGDCMEFPGLPEAVNTGQYLVPRMTRDELRAAITGPVAVGGGKISPRLVLRLLNDLGDDQDQLPVLQHALMRTWEHWQQSPQAGEPMDIPNYEAVGTMSQALSLHAEEAYQEAGTERGQLIAEKMFKALTDTVSDQRGVRRPTSIQELAAVCEAPKAEVVHVIEIFRRHGRSFLMPPPTVELDSRSIIDVSHESLMRCWTRLIGWAEEEKVSAGYYGRLSQAAGWFAAGLAGLWRNPELEQALLWKQKNQPTGAWAQRYDEHFERAMQFLDRSQTVRDGFIALREKERKRKLREYQWAAGVLGILLLIAGILAEVARREKNRAELNLQLAQDAVNEMLSSAGSKQARVAADLPEMEEFRKELLEKAQTFYATFTKQKPDSEQLASEVGRAHFRLGDIHRLLSETDAAAAEYKEAIAQFQNLANQYPGKPDYRQALANSYNWLGETLRTHSATRPEAEQAYNSALQIQEGLLSSGGEKAPAYQRELARTHYNRGILRYELQHPDPSEQDFHDAIRLLKPLAENPANLGQAQELARAQNDLGTLLRDKNREPESQAAYEQAVRIGERLTKGKPDSREYKFELATYYDNLALLLLDQGKRDLAINRNRQAVALLDDLASPAPSLSIEMAKGHNLSAQILESLGSPQAKVECQRSLDILTQALKARNSRERPEFGFLFRDLGYNYLDLAKSSFASGSLDEANITLENLSRVLPEIPEPDKSRLTELSTKLRQQLSGKLGTRR